MLPMEHLHLKHVLQAVCALESVILRSFGPEGGQVLFLRDTGQAMLSRSGARILTALRVDHPMARMVVECVRKHSTVTGDGSKTFILLLASLLRMIHATASKEPNVSQSYKSTEAAEAATARHLADKLLAFALTELDDLIAVSVVPYGFCVSLEDFTTKTQLPAHPKQSRVQRLLSSFYHTRIGFVHRDFFSDLTCEMLDHWKSPTDQSLRFLNDNFSALNTQVSGFPISSSRLIEGQIIHRDFATPPCLQANKQLVKAVIFTGYLQPELLSPGDVLELSCGSDVMEEKSIIPFSTWTERSLECVIAVLQSFGVSVLLCAVKQSAAALALAAQAEMCLVECVSEEELSLFAQLSGVTPVSNCWMIQQGNVATLSFLKPILLGAHRYVHVGFSDSQENIKPCSLVICGAGEGQTNQYACAFQDAFRMLFTALEPTCVAETTALKKNIQIHKNTSLHVDNLPEGTETSNICVLEQGCVIPAGGTFEFLLHHALLQHGHGYSNVGVCVSRILANALLNVPRQIYSHNPKRFLLAQIEVTSFMSSQSHSSQLFKEKHNTSPKQTEGPEKTDAAFERFASDSSLESVSCKYRLLLAVLQCLVSLLRVNTAVWTHTALHTRSHKLINSSWESTDDEIED